MSVQPLWMAVGAGPPRGIGMPIADLYVCRIVSALAADAVYGSPAEISWSHVVRSDCGSTPGGER